jgi:hypothetical protein
MPQKDSNINNLARNAPSSNMIVIVLETGLLMHVLTHSYVMSPYKYTKCQVSNRFKRIVHSNPLRLQY